MTDIGQVYVESYTINCHLKVDLAYPLITRFFAQNFGLKPHLISKLYPPNLPLALFTYFFTDIRITTDICETYKSSTFDII